METILPLQNPASEGPLRGLVKRSARVLFSPVRFFRYDLPAMDTATALTFGVGNAWAASIAAFFIQTLNTLLVAQLLDRWMQRLLSDEDGFSVWSLSPRSFLWTSGLTLLGPFLYLIQITVGGFGLYLFARLLVEERADAPEQVTYEACLRIQSAALVSEWYSLVPVFGGLLSFIAGLVLLVTGVRERFGVSTRRACAVVFAPFVMLVFVIVVFLVLAALMATQIPFADLLDLDTSQAGF